MIHAGSHQSAPSARGIRTSILTIHHILFSHFFRAANQLSSLCLIFLVLATIPACSTAASSDRFARPTQRPYRINNKVYYPIPSSYGFTQNGIASWYGAYFHGRRTSNGEIYNMYALTAAHKTLPMNTVLLVENLENGREAVVRINDRGPFVRGRIIDLSYTASKKLNMVGKGTAKVRITALGSAEQEQTEIMRMAQQFYHGEFYVQIGSFAKMDNALRLQQRFTQAGHTTLIQKYYGNKKTYHRVHVYVGKTLQGAMQAQRVLEKRGYRGTFVIAH